MKPVRIQRKRTAGYDMHAVSRATNSLDCVSVTRPGRWGNPYDVRVFGRDLAMKLFRETMEGCWNPSLVANLSDELCDAAYTAHHAFLKRIREHPASAARSELRGKNLACYCDLPQLGEPDLCHAAIQQRLAVADDKHAGVLLLASDGRLRWRNSAAFSDVEYTELKNKVQEQLQFTKQRKLR